MGRFLARTSFSVGMAIDHILVGWSVWRLLLRGCFLALLYWATSNLMKNGWSLVNCCRLCKLWRHQTITSWSIVFGCSICGAYCFPYLLSLRSFPAWSRMCGLFDMVILWAIGRWQFGEWFPLVYFAIFGWWKIKEFWGLELFEASSEESLHSIYTVFVRKLIFLLP